METQFSQPHQLQAGDEVIDDGDVGKTRFRRKVTRRKEVPFIRQVKVPVTRQKVIPTTIQKKIPTKIKRQVDDFEEVEEQYTDFVEEKAIREKKIWVEETVMEEYVKKVPETIVRMVKKPITRVEEITELRTVEVKTSREEDIRGWRVDEIEERKIIEVDEWEIFEFIPHSTHQIIDGPTRDLGIGSRVPNHRVIGKRVYFPAKSERDAAELSHIALDDMADEHHVQPLFKRNDDGTWESVGYTAGVGNNLLDLTPTSLPPAAHNASQMNSAITTVPPTSSKLTTTQTPSNMSQPMQSAPVTTGSSTFSRLDTAPHWDFNDDNTTSTGGGGDEDLGGHGWDLRLSNHQPSKQYDSRHPPSSSVDKLTHSTASLSLTSSSPPIQQQASARSYPPPSSQVASQPRPQTPVEYDTRIPIRRQARESGTYAPSSFQSPTKDNMNSGNSSNVKNISPGALSTTSYTSKTSSYNPPDRTLI